MSIPKGGQRGGQGSVMAGRFEAQDSLDDFPTPPWATRALIHHVLPYLIDGSAPKFANSTAWEPAANRGIMSEVLKEYFGSVVATDVHDYGKALDFVGSFVGNGSDVARWPYTLPYVAKPDWIITNPPFRLGEEFVRRAVIEAQIGVAMLARTTFIESASRYPIFTGGGFACFAPFAGRVAMVKDRWDPTASTATSYAWFVWKRDHRGSARFMLIPPDAKQRLSHVDDVERFAGPRAEAAE